MAGTNGSNKMSPAGSAFFAVGSFVQAYGKYHSLMAQSQAEQDNAAYYREQADYAQQAGAREHTIYEHESKILYGEQLSGFAKAGISSSNSSFFMASQMLQRSQGLNAIDKETQQNSQLASLRAQEADRVAGQDRNAASLETAATLVTAAAILL